MKQKYKTKQKNAKHMCKASGQKQLEHLFLVTAQATFIFMKMKTICNSSEQRENNGGTKKEKRRQHNNTQRGEITFNHISSC